MKTEPPTALLLVFLCLLASFGPITTDIYVPSLPVLLGVFSMDASTAGWTISIYSIAAGLMLIVCGQISDVYGRQPILRFCLMAYVTSAVATTLSTDVAVLGSMRVLQACGATAAITAAFATARDRYPPEGRGKAMGIISMARSAAPIEGLILGATSVQWLGWQGPFCAMAALGALAFTASLCTPESLALEHRQPSIKPKALIQSMAVLLTNRIYLAYCFGDSFLMSGAISWFVNGSYVLQKFYGLSLSSFSLVYVMLMVCGTVGSIASGVVRTKAGWSASFTFMIGYIIASGAAVALAAMAYFDTLDSSNASLMRLQGGLVFLFFGQMFAMVQSVGAAIEPFPERAGLATGLMASIRFLIISAVPPAVGIFIDIEHVTPHPPLYGAAICIVSGLVMYLLLRPPEKEEGEERVELK